MNQMLMGAIAMASLAVGLVFFKFWRNARDPFFLYFAFSFWVEAANRIVLGLLDNSNEASPLVYLVRVVSYGLILLGILQKNRRNR